MRWFFQSATHPFADSVLARLDTDMAIVPVLWRYEVSAVLAKSQRNGTVTPFRVAEFIQTLKTLNISLDPASANYILTDVHRLAISHRLTSYDAAYLELAIRMDLPLATLDDELIGACKASGVALL